MIQVGALTSYSQAPLRTKILELAEHGITNIDLYCFCASDIPDVAPHEVPPGEWLSYLQHLDTRYAADRIHAFCEEARTRGSGPIDICGIASFFPDISLPDACPGGSYARGNTVKILKGLLDLARQLRERHHYSCKTFELVAGHTIVKPPAWSQPKTLRLMSLDPKACREALAKSLADLTDHAHGMFQDGKKAPWLVFELEPGLGKLLRDGPTLKDILPVLRKFPNVGINLDIGHMLIIDNITIDDVFGTGAADLLGHAHVSDHARRSHFADLPVKSFHGADTYKPWLRALVDHDRKRAGCFQGTISVEMEACGEIAKVRRTWEQTRDWLAEVGN